MHALLQDVRYAVRSFRATRGLTAAAILSLALGIGANTSIFSVASALLLQPLPYSDPDRLAILWNRSPGLGIAEDWFSTAQYFDITGSGTSFDQVAIALGAHMTLTGGGEPERIGMIRVSASLLPLLGAKPALGRLFAPEDDEGGSAAARIVILHHGTWMRRFGGDPAAVGRSITLNDQSYEVVGVMPPAFTLPREVMNTLGGAEEAEILIPLPLGPGAAQRRNGEDYNIMARLRPGVTIAQAQAEMDALTARLRREHPDFYPPNGGLTFSVVPLKQQVVGDVTRPLFILVAAVAFVLLIACANVANLLMSRSLGRQKEIAIRTALGAGRGRILRQLLTESVLLAVAGGALGLLLALASIDAIHALGTRSVPRLHEIRIDGLVLAFTVVVSVLSGILFGLAPALRLGRADVQTSLKEGGRGASGAHAIWGRGAGLRGVLVAGELALCVMVLIAAGLLVRSFARVQQVAPGFNPSGVLTFQVSLVGRKYADGARVQQAYRAMWDRLGALPGVTAAGGVTALPLSQMFAWGPITVEGRPVTPEEKFINVDQRTVGGRYFAAMEIPLVAGRFFNDEDTADTPRVVVIDERMADQLWPGQDPVGKRIRTGGFDVAPDTPWMTVIGVTGRVKQYTLDGEEPRIAMYHWHRQRPSRTLNVVVRTAGADPARLAPAARQVLRDLDPDLPIYSVQTMQARVDESLARRRFAMTLLTLFAALAFGLAAIGTYGVIAYLVSQGTREIGIRMALGATPEGVAGMVVRGGMTLAAIGIAAGLAGALLLTRFMEGLLFGVGASDPATFAAIVGLLTVMALAATYVPARRAARIDPLLSLRAE
ncbi:MAG TPA: ABC transporter permease [Vicinamibacterales bacterium]|nr:ABC transporter permease [Vicinamibacterales bacterium]